MRENTKYPALCLNPGDLATLLSIQEVTESFYTMEYTGDYFLDTLLKQGTEDSADLGDFISRAHLQGLPFPREMIRLACSAFAAQNPAGDYIYGRNMDFSLTQNMLVRTAPAHGYASLSMVNLGTMGYWGDLPDSAVGRLFALAAPYLPLDGINEKGLSMAVLLQTGAQAVCQDTGKLPVTTTLAIRMVLDRAATVEEAIGLLKDHDMRGMASANYHFLIADARGGRAVVEYVNNTLRVIYPQGFGQAVTNFYLSPDADEPYYDGKDRLESLQAALDEGKGVVTEAGAWQMLKSVKAVHELDPATGIDFNTLYSIVFNNTRRAMDICIKADFDTVYSYSVREPLGTVEKRINT